MARKRRLPYDCFACGKRFKSAQAVRGHRRHCRYPRLKREAEAEAAAQPGVAAAQRNSGSTLRERLRSSQGAEADRVRRRPGPLSYETRLLSLDAWEGLEQLQRTARHFKTVASSMAAMNVAREFERAKEWAEMCQILDDSLRDFDPMLPSFRLDRSVLFGIYTSIRHLKERWIKERVCSFFRPALEPDGLDEATRTMLREEEAVFTRLIDQLKRLVVAAP
jgi:hypothetical protein